MKTMHSLRLALAGAAALLSQTASAQTWQTVDDFQYAVGKNSYATGLAKDPAGNLYAAGVVRDSSDLWHAVARKSADDGVTWAIIDDYWDPTGGSGPGYDAGMTADTAGNLYAAGNLFVPGGTSMWFVRRSQNGGLTWSTVDTFTFGGSQAFLRALSTDSAGNVYLVGIANTSGSVNYTIVRKGVPTGGSGIAWTTVNAVPETSFGLPTTPGALFCHPTAGIFVAGHGGGSRPSWIVRRSQDGGATWAIVDTYLLDAKQGALAKGVGADASGNVYVVGKADKTYRGSSQSHWIVRKSSNGGASWQTVDDSQPSGTGGEAIGFAPDSHGNLFVIGSAWFVRKNAAGVGNWQTVDNFAGAGKTLVGGNSGNIFAAGLGYANGLQHWVVRKGTP